MTPAEESDLDLDPYACIDIVHLYNARKASENIAKASGK